LAGATVLVTGGGNGLGRRLAIGAARRGARVVIWDVSAERAGAVRDQIRAHGLRADARTVDVTDKAAVQAAAKAVGDVDVLVNNAGVVSGQPLLEGRDAGIERTLNVNVLALYWVTRAVLPGMFAGVRTRFPLLLPILKEGDVARTILDGIESGKQQIVLPPMVRLIPVARVLPVRAFDWFMDVMGVNRTMEHFTGRPGDVVGGPTA